MRFEKGPSDGKFSVAVICDTQNYASYCNQTEAGFPINSREILWDMMEHVVRNAESSGGDIAFLTGLGDSWFHPSVLGPNERHAEGGAAPNPVLEAMLPASPREVREHEMPAIRQAYEIVGKALPFSVVPGNHDHDYVWTNPALPPSTDDAAMDPSELINRMGALHFSSLEGWKQVFGDQTSFFRDKPWYVSSFRDGTSSAQIFTAGGYRILHLGLEMCPDDEVIGWARSVLADHPGLPTIVSIHEFLNETGERASIDVVNLTFLEPERNGPEALWQKLVAPNDQIFMVINGHFHGVRNRVDLNDHGHKVYHFLVNYQGRKQLMKDSCPDTKVLDGIGDGWIRLLNFDLGAEVPKLALRAYSSYYKAYASDLPLYAQWYGAEHPGMSAEDFLALDETVFELNDFRQRFGNSVVNRESEAVQG